MLHREALTVLIYEGYPALLFSRRELSAPLNGDDVGLPSRGSSVSLCLERHPWLSDQPSHAAFLTDAALPLPGCPAMVPSDVVESPYTRTVDFRGWAEDHCWSQVSRCRYAPSFLTHLLVSKGIFGRLDVRIRHVCGVMGTHPADSVRLSRPPAQ